VVGLLRLGSSRSLDGLLRRPRKIPGGARSAMACPICNKRKAERFCPAKGEKICAVCCGTEREVTIDCPTECTYLVAAHRYEEEHRKPVSPEEVPYRDVEFSPDLIHELRPVVSGLGYTILKFAAAQPSLVDADALKALEALAETYRTLTSGIYYEKPPEAPLPNALYQELAKMIQDFKQHEADSAGFSRLKDTDVFHLLVFLLRVGRYRTNGRPRSRGFLEFLRAQYPHATDLARAQSRIIAP
jgi:hypothetical protein